LQSQHEFNNQTYYCAKIMPIDSNSITSHFFNSMALRKKSRHSIAFITTATSWIDRQLFYQLGKFDEEFPDAAGEDSEFCIRVHTNQINVEETDIHVYHDNPTTLSGLINRAQRYATKGWLYHVKLNEFFLDNIAIQKSNTKTRVLDTNIFKAAKKIRRFYLWVEDGLKKTSEQHIHHFTKFSLRGKMKFILLAFIWEYAYRVNVKKQENKH
jgi:hypothetical protein